MGRVIRSARAARSVPLCGDTDIYKCATLLHLQFLMIVSNDLSCARREREIKTICKEDAFYAPLKFVVMQSRFGHCDDPMNLLFRTCIENARAFAAACFHVITTLNDEHWTLTVGLRNRAQSTPSRCVNSGI